MSIDFSALEHLALSDYERRGVETVKRIIARAEARSRGEEVADVPKRFMCSARGLSFFPNLCAGDQGFYLRRTSSASHDVSETGVVGEENDNSTVDEGDTAVLCVVCDRVAYDRTPGVSLTAAS